MKIIKLILLNRLALYIVDVTIEFYKNTKISKRVMASYIECFYSMFVIFPWLIIIVFITQAGQYFLSIIFKTNPLPINQIMSTGSGLLGIILINKDFIKGQGVVHRIFGFQVLDSKSGLPAAPLKCLIRNVTALFAPIEWLILIFRPERRLGDMIAGTKVIQVPVSKPELILDEMRGIRVDASTKQALLISALIFGVWELWTLSF